MVGGLDNHSILSILIDDRYGQSPSPMDKRKIYLSRRETRYAGQSGVVVARSELERMGCRCLLQEKKYLLSLLLSWKTEEGIGRETLTRRNVVLKPYVHFWALSHQQPGRATESR